MVCSLFEPLPRFLDIQEFNRLTPALLFEKVYNLVIQDVQGVRGREYSGKRVSGFLGTSGRGQTPA